MALKIWHDSKPIMPLEVATYPPGVAHPWIRWIAEPRVISVLLGFFHVCAIAAGVAAILIPDDYYEMVGNVTADAWGMLMILGGIAGAAGALPGYWWLERAGLVLEFFAVAAWEVALWTVHRDPTSVCAFRAALGAMVQVACVNRYVRIQGAYLDPRRAKSLTDARSQP